MSSAKSLTRIYFPQELPSRSEWRLPPPQAHHVARVLRLAAGDALTLFNGDGTEYDAVLESVSAKAATVRIHGRRAASAEPVLEIELAQGLSSGERMDYTVQKAVELGATAIHPLATIRSVVRLSAERAARRTAHWQSIAVAACEQCGRNRVPPVAPPARLEDWLAGGAAALRVMLSPRAATRLPDVPRPSGPVIVLAGPEGGLSDEEEALARRAGFVPVRLGPRVLRTETAALAALAAMQTLWGDYRGQ